MDYYYLISSLPMLKYDGEMAISYDKFLEMCKPCVSKKKYQILENLSIASDKGVLVDEWAKFYDDLKTEMTYQRNRKLGHRVDASDKKDDVISKHITSAVNNKNPFDAEKMLLAFEFEKLDEFIGLHFFDDYALMGYALKLKLLERKAMFKKEDGKKEFNRIINELEEQIMSMEQE